MRSFFLIFIASFFLQIRGYSQQPLTRNTSEEIDKYFQDAINGRSYYITKQVLENIDSKTFLKSVKPYLSSQNSNVRYSAINIITRKALLIKSSTERYEYVLLLIQACKDKDSGNCGAAANALMQFTKDDFAPRLKDSLYAVLKYSPYHVDKFIKLAGFAEIEQSKDFLKENFLNNPSASKRNQWAAHLALARMGDSTSLNYCLNILKSEDLNDRVVDYLFPDLIYTRQHEAIDYMLHEILSDEKKCSSPNPDSDEKILCAYRIIELVAPVIENFPIPVNNYGEPEIDDYDKTLEVVREWIRTQPSYNVSRSKF